jgi:signal transduction histidine kinase
MEGRVRGIDIAPAAVAVVVLVAAMAVVEHGPDDRPFDALAVALVLAAGGALALRRRAPMAVLAVTTSALALYGLREYPDVPLPLTVIVAIYALTVARGPARSWAPAAVAAVVLVATVFNDATTLFPALFVSWAAGAVVLGGSVLSRRSELVALEERARHLAETREEEARRRVAEERLRIARDLHDSVAHTLASISVQAGVGAHVLDERPDDARDALLAIKDTSREALSELRATLGMLRSDDTTSREPAAGLDRLPALVASSRATGLPVDLVVEGEARPLPPAIDAAAFRIVQESLTNVIRHAGPARATVAVRHGDDGLEIEVTDDGRGAPSDPAGAAGAIGATGHGLAGMRERVALLGGAFDAGSRPDGGYRVRARLPL